VIIAIFDNIRRSLIDIGLAPFGHASFLLNI